MNNDASSPDEDSCNSMISFESAVRNGWTPSRGSFAGIRRVNSQQTKRFMTDGAVMPDGGLSPCIIKVVGVGGGGCNAVSDIFLWNQ